jgi:ABC-type transporter Mla subunit MlaD
MQGAEERRLNRMGQYAADDALMVDQGCLPSFTVPDQYDIIVNLDIQCAVKVSIRGKKMRNNRFWILPLIFVYVMAAACVGSLQLTVLYDRTEGLKQNDPVLWNEQKIGKVQSVKQNGQDRASVQLQISKDFSDKVTDESRFVIQADPQRQGESFVKMVNLSEKGNPLPRGTAVEGSTSLSLKLEKTERGLVSWREQLERELERWEEELSQLPEREWYKELEREMDYWLNKLGQAGVETREYFKEEVLPRLEEALRELRKRLRQLGKEKEIETLEVKLDKLKNI